MYDENRPHRPAREDRAASVGESLRQAREQDGLSVDEAAAQLNIAAAAVYALEQGRFESLGASVYVKGHLRNYAQLVGLDADALLRDLGPWQAQENIAGPAPQAGAAVAAAAVPRQEGPVQALWRKLRWGLLALLWWLRGLPRTVSSDYRAARPWQKAALVFLSVTVLALALSLLLDGIRSPRIGGGDPPLLSQAGDPVDGPAAPVPGGTQTPADTGPVAGPGTAGPGQAGGVPLADERPEEPPPAVVETPESPPTVAQEPADTPPVVDASPPPPPTAQSPVAGLVRLQIAFTGPCWVEIYDATGQRIYVALASAGDVADLTGQAPFRVSLGNPAVARVEVNGQLFQPPPDFFLRGDGFFSIPAPVTSTANRLD